MGKQITLVGTLPPPIGGVTIHIKRLRSYLEEKKYDFYFFDYKREGLTAFIQKAKNSKVIHFNFSNHWALLLFSVISLILGNKIIYTIHGNILNRGNINKCIIKCLIPIIDIFIVLNETSEKYLEKYTDKVRVMPAFIAPLSDPDLPADIIQEIVDLKKKTRLLLSTNASSLNYDRKGKEVYGINELVNEVKNHSEIGLVISNPAGDYLEEVGTLPKNIIILPILHDFTGVLKYSDVFIRNTTTDGDSLSVKEAINLGVPVFATDVIDRHEGCHLYELHNMDELISAIKKGQYRNEPNYDLDDFTDHIITVYKES